MSYRTNTDNIYPVGSTVKAKNDPIRTLVIRKYYQRIYYCDAVDTEGGKRAAYFERELMLEGGQ